MTARRLRPWISIVSAILVAVAIGFMTIRYLNQARVANDMLIADHIAQLKDIFTRINERCKITGFRYSKDQVDFLNIISFAGSIVGSMNLLEPQHWQGPYLTDNLTMYGKEYQLITTKKGTYVIPGDGVKLSNGKIIGKTLMITPESDIEAMLHDPQALLSQGRPLGAYIETNQRHSVKEPANVLNSEVDIFG